MNQRPPIDLSKLTFKCHCCNQDRMDKFIKTFAHDVSKLFDLVTGTMFVNCRYCNDMPSCAEKASNREWIINKFFSKFVENTDHKIAVLE